MAQGKDVPFLASSLGRPPPWDQTHKKQNFPLPARNERGEGLRQTVPDQALTEGGSDTSDSDFLFEVLPSPSQRDRID